MSGYFALAPRPLRPDDAGAARVLLMGALGVTPYVDRALEVLELAKQGDHPEYRAIVVERDGTVAALALFGEVAGADAAARLFTAAVAPGVERSDVGGRLVDAVAEAARRDGARFLVAELPDDPAIGAVLALLREHGFREEARVVDYFRDGVALSVLRLGL